MIYDWPKPTNIDPRRALQNWPGQEAFYRAAGQKPNLDIDFTKRTIVDRVAGVVPVFTRSSTQIAWGGSNFISYAPDVPAFRLASDGVWEYLHEPAATNIFLYSRMIGTGWATPSGATTSTISGATPEQDWYRFVEDTTTNRRAASRTESSGLVSGNQYTASFVCRRRAGTAKRFPQFVWNNSTSFSPAPVFVSWDLDTLAFGTNNAAATGKATRLAADIFLLETTITATGTGAGQFQFGWNTSLGIGNNSYLGDGVSGFDFTLPQLELGPVATSRIYANGSYVTRSACSLTISDKDFTSFYDQSGGVWYTEASINAVGQTAAAVYSIDRSGDSAEGMQLGANATDGSVYTYHTDENVIQSNILFPGQANNSQRFKAASSFSLNNCNASVNGSIGTADTSAALPSPDRIAIGAGPALTTVPLLLRRLTYFPPGITQSRIQQLTIPDWWYTERLWRIAEQRPALDIEFNRQGIVDRISGITPTFTRPTTPKLAWNGSQYLSYAADVPAFQLSAGGIWEYLHEPAATNLNPDAVDLSARSRPGLIAPIMGSELTPVFQGIPTQAYLEDTSTGVHQISIQQFPTVAGSQYTITCIFKPYLASGAIRRLNVVASGGTAGWPGNQNCTFRVSNETISSSGIAGATFERLSNQYYVLKCTTVAAGSTGTSALAIRFTEESTGLFSYTGDASAGFHIAYLGVETGPVATSPIITTGSVATRNADTMTIAGVDFNSFYNQLGGVLYFEGTVSPTGVSRGLVGVDNTTNSERYRIGLTNSEASQVVVVDDGSVVVSFTDGTFTTGTNKVAARFALNDTNISLNGSLGSGDTSCTMPTPTQFTIGNVQAVAGSIAAIRRVTYWPPGPAQSRIQQLTAAIYPNEFQNAAWLPLQQSRLWVTAQQVPALDIDFTNLSITDRIGGITPTFTRPTTPKLLWNGSQFVSYGPDVPGFQLAADGVWEYMHEPAATNACTNNQTVVQSAIQSTASFVASAIGPGNMVSLREQATTNAHYVDFFSTGLAGTAGTVTVSTRVKGVGRSTVKLEILHTGDSLVGNGSNVVFDLALQTVTSSSPYASNAKVKALANGWYEIAFSVTLGGGSTLVRPRILAFDGPDQTYLGDPLKGLDIYLVQLEAGPAATSPIITTGSAATRNADTLVFIGASQVSGNPLGAAYVEFQAVGFSSANYEVVYFGDNTNNNRISLQTIGSAPNLRPIYTSGGVIQSNFNLYSTSLMTTRNKVAFNFGAGQQYRAAVNGLTPVGSTVPASPVSPATITRLEFGRNGNGLVSHAYRRFAYFPRINFSDALLQALTT